MSEAFERFWMEIQGETWWKKYKGICKQAFLAGQTYEREQCAELVEELIALCDNCKEEVSDEIRKRGNDD